MISKEVGIEGDRRSVGIFEALFRLEGLAEGLGGDNAGPEILQKIINVGFKNRLPIFLSETYISGLSRLIGSLFVLADRSAIEVGIAAEPDRKMTKVILRQGPHIRFLSHHEVGDPFLIGGEDVEGSGSNGRVVVVGRSFVFLDGMGLDEDVVVDPVVAVQDCHEAGDFRAMTDVVRRIARFPLTVDDGIHTGVHQNEGTEHQIVDKSQAFAGDRRRDFGKKHIVVDERRAMSDFNKDAVT